MNLLIRNLNSFEFKTNIPGDNKNEKTIENPFRLNRKYTQVKNLEYNPIKFLDHLMEYEILLSAI